MLEGVDDEIRFDHGEPVLPLFTTHVGKGVGGITPPIPPPVPPDFPGAGPGGGGGLRFRQAEIICFQAVSKEDSVVAVIGGVTGRRVVPPNVFLFRFIDGTVGSTPSGGTDEEFGVGGGASEPGASVLVDEVVGLKGSRKLTAILNPFPTIFSSANTKTIAWLPVDVITVPGAMSVPQK